MSELVLLCYKDFSYEIFSGLKLAMVTPSDFYRDFYFYLYINGKVVPEMDNCSVEPPRDLNFFISSSLMASGDADLTRVCSLINKTKCHLV